jgi:hypothetical protein
MGARNLVGIGLLVPARQANIGWRDWIDSLESILGHLKSLKIRAQLTWYRPGSPSLPIKESKVRGGDTAAETTAPETGLPPLFIVADSEP